MVSTEELRDIQSKIDRNIRLWEERNKRMKEWYKLLLLIDELEAKNMESYVSNEPATFYQMAHYLLTKGDIQHFIPIQSESAIDLDNRAKVHRACEYMWMSHDRNKRLGGGYPFLAELGFHLLVLGWYSVALYYDDDLGILIPQLWNPFDTYPNFVNGELESCVHTYLLSVEEAKSKAEKNDWIYEPRQKSGIVTLRDFYETEEGVLRNIITIDNQDVTGWVDRPNMRLLVAPVGGYPDIGGGLTPEGTDWRKLLGKGIFEVDSKVYASFNKWKSMVNQILRDTAQPITMEFSGTPQATPEQLRERGALFHYSAGEQGLLRLPPPAIPLELQSNLLDLSREKQKGSFTDNVFGLAEGQPGYSISLLASSSANQILFPYMEAKHFVLEEADRFWLSMIKEAGKPFVIKGVFLEELLPDDIPEDVSVMVKSNVATPKDWLERGTIGGLMREDVDEATLLGDIYGFSDPQGIKRRKVQDKVMGDPLTLKIQIINGYLVHADYLESRGDTRQARLFRSAAQLAEAQMGAPAPGQGLPANQGMIEEQRKEGAPAQKAKIPSRVSPPESRGFTPQQLRQSIGTGKVRMVK